MSSWFTIELDTTGPEINVYTQTWVTINNNLYVSVEYNEPLDTGWYTAILTDSNKQPHNIILRDVGGILVGSLQILSIPEGSAFLEVRVRDQVNNLSNLVKQRIEILPQAVLTISLMEPEVTEIEVKECKTGMVLNEVTAPVYLIEEKTSIELEDNRVDINLVETYKGIRHY